MGLVEARPGASLAGVLSQGAQEYHAVLQTLTQFLSAINNLLHTGAFYTNQEELIQAFFSVCACVYLRSCDLFSGSDCLDSVYIFGLSNPKQGKISEHIFNSVFFT